MSHFSLFFWRIFNNPKLFFILKTTLPNKGIYKRLHILSKTPIPNITQRYTKYSELETSKINIREIAYDKMQGKKQ
jgi:hypothetical protein